LRFETGLNLLEVRLLIATGVQTNDGHMDLLAHKTTAGPSAARRSAHWLLRAVGGEWSGGGLARIAQAPHRPGGGLVHLGSLG
jgi:hypothetical protein